ncbi:unnamed protein product [Schistosoma spindalis]|nr:unnamed protein product [Schistosoma spindale]
MCSEFYVTWCQLLEKNKNYRKIASIYAHGLRAGAKPLLWLEDRAEAFFKRYENSLKSTVPSSSSSLSLSTDIVGTFTSDYSCNENDNENTRKKLASLRLIETGTQENSLVVPVIRTKEMWCSNQSGLGTIRSSETIISNKCNYQIKKDKLSEENSIFIRDLQPITSDFIRPIGIPSSWQKENQLEPSTWNKAQLSTTTTAPVSSRPIGLPDWEIFTEDQVEQQQPQQADSSNSLNNTQQSTICTKRKGLKMKSSSFKDYHTDQQFNEISFIDITLFNHLLHQSNNIDLLLLSTKLNLPSYPGDKLSDIDCFAFDIKLIYGGIEELCWEMHRGIKWDINYHNSSLNNNNNTLTQYDHHRNMLNGFWDKEELEVIQEIDSIIHNDDDDDDGTMNNLQINDQLLKNKNIESTRHALIKSLECIALNKES